MIKKSVFLLKLFLIVFIIPVSAQQWEYIDYKTIDHTNFRKDSRVNQTFDKDNPDIPLMNALLFFITNEQRVENNLKPLKYNSACEIAAYNHSLKMVKLDFFAHSNIKDKSRVSTSDRAKLAGIKNPYIAENIAYIHPNYSDTYLAIAEKFIDNWMKSERHRANILSDKALQFGCGVYLDENKAYATQVYQWFMEIQTIEAKDKLPKLKNGEQPKISE